MRGRPPKNKAGAHKNHLLYKIHYTLMAQLVETGKKLRDKRFDLKQIANKVNCHSSTVSRFIKRSLDPRNFGKTYDASICDYILGLAGIEIPLPCKKGFFAQGSASPKDFVATYSHKKTEELDYGFYINPLNQVSTKKLPSEYQKYFLDRSCHAFICKLDPGGISFKRPSTHRGMETIMLLEGEVDLYLDYTIHCQTLESHRLNVEKEIMQAIEDTGKPPGKLPPVQGIAPTISLKENYATAHIVSAMYHVFSNPSIDKPAFLFVQREQPLEK